MLVLFIFVFAMFWLNSEMLSLTALLAACPVQEKRRAEVYGRKDAAAGAGGPTDDDAAVPAHPRSALARFFDKKQKKKKA